MDVVYAAPARTRTTFGSSLINVNKACSKSASTIHYLRGSPESTGFQASDRQARP